MFFSNALVGTIMVLGLIALFWPLIQFAGRASAPCDRLTAVDVASAMNRRTIAVML